VRAAYRVIRTADYRQCIGSIAQCRYHALNSVSRTRIFEEICHRVRRAAAIEESDRPGSVSGYDQRTGITGSAEGATTNDHLIIEVGPENWSASAAGALIIDQNRCAD